jgi:hypothetical protein
MVITAFDRRANATMRQMRGLLPHSLFFKISIALLVTLLSILGCEFPERPRRITISSPRSFKPLRPSELKSLEQALEMVVTVARDDLGLPVVDPIHLNLYRNSLSFAAYGYGYTTLPVDVSNTSAMARGSSIHVDLEKSGVRPGPGWVASLAHEYGHTIQASIAGEKGLQIHWLVEGFAEWVSAKVLDSLGWQSYQVSRYRAYQELDRHRDLLTFNSGDGWQHLLAEPRGRIRSYTLGFAFADKLIQEKGLSVMLDYLRSGDFERSFGISQSKFFDDFQNDLIMGRPSQILSELFLRPDWRPNDRWTYRETRPGVSSEVTGQVTAETLVWGVPCFVMRMGDETRYYLKATLSLIGVAKDGQIVAKNSKPDRDAYWPLRVGFEWQNAFTHRDFAEGATRRINYKGVVAREESVTVPAGSFRSVLVQSYGFQSGRLLAEYWYVPSVKWFVRSRSFNYLDGYSERQLVKFKIS